MWISEHTTNQPVSETDIWAINLLIRPDTCWTHSDARARAQNIPAQACAGGGATRREPAVRGKFTQAKRNKQQHRASAAADNRVPSEPPPSGPGRHVTSRVSTFSVAFGVGGGAGGRRDSKMTAWLSASLEFSSYFSEDRVGFLFFLTRWEQRTWIRMKVP